MLTWTLRVIAAVVALVTLMPLVRRDAWWIRACEFPRAQILVVAVAVFVAVPFVDDSLVGRLVLAAVVGAAALLQGLRILPFTSLWYRQDSPSAEAGGSETLGILISNILMTNRQVEAFLASVQELDPDLVLVVEANGWWRRELEPLRGAYPHTIEQPQEDTYGMLLFSRLEIAASEVRFLVDDQVPSVRCSVTLPSGREVTFYGLHPKPPAPQEATETTERDAELLLVAREARGCPGATIVAGDLNDVAWSYTTRLFRRISGLLDPRIGRGLLPTFPASRPWLRFPLDHVFHSVDLALVDLRRVETVGSDHLSIYVRLRYADEPEEDAEAPTPAEGDLEVAQEKIDRGLEAAE